MGNGEWLGGKEPRKSYIIRSSLLVALRYGSHQPHTKWKIKKIFLQEERYSTTTVQFSLYILHEFHTGEVLLAQTLPYVQLGTEGVERKTFFGHTTCCFLSSSRVPVSVFSMSSYNRKHQESRRLPK